MELMRPGLLANKPQGAVWLYIPNTRITSEPQIWCLKEERKKEGRKDRRKQARKEEIKKDGFQ